MVFVGTTFNVHNSCDFFEIGFFVTLKTKIPQFHQDFGIGFGILFFSCLPSAISFILLGSFFLKKNLVPINHMHAL